MLDTSQKTLVHQYYDIINRGDLDALDQLVSPGYRYHAPGLPPSLFIFKQMLLAYRVGFPDLNHVVEQLISEGDRVVAYVTTQGTHTGPFLGHAPTHQHFSAAGVDIFRLEQGRLVERWGAFDTLSMLQQLGLYQPVPT